MRAHVRLASALLLALAAGSAPPAAAFRVMGYNLLNYSSGRTAQFQLVIEHTQPDILVVEEILSQGAVNTFLSTVLDVVDPGEWAAAEFTNGPDTDNALFFKPALFDTLGHHVVTTALRNIDEWTLRPIGYTDPASNLRIYAAHLKASQGFEADRLAEVQLLRQRLETFPPNQNYLLTGDLNLYTSTEPAYQWLLGTAGGPNGALQDPINTPGSWHNSATFAAIHTQSPRTAQFGGGANGGMDDRFDFILTSPALNLATGSGLDVLPSTYEAFGNDGAHFNKAIIDAPAHPTIPAAVIQALHDGSDHLPILSNFSVPSLLIAGDAVNFGSWIQGSTAGALLAVENPAIPPADPLDYSFSAPAGFDAPAGGFSLPAASGAVQHTLAMQTSTAGELAGSLAITSDAPDTPLHLVALSGTILEPSSPSVESDIVSTLGTIDFGTHPLGAFVDLPAVIYNVDPHTYRAEAEIHDATLTGDARFSFTGGFVIGRAGVSPASWPLHFDDSGATDGEYTASIVFHTRDQSDVNGFLPRADITFELLARVDSGVLAAGGATEAPLLAGIGTIAPNPFHPATRVSFGVRVPGVVSLRVYDVAGRKVRTLLDGSVGVGNREASWDGRDDAGRALAAGTYYLRLETPERNETRVVVRANR